MDDAGSFSEIKQECKEDLLDIVDNLKQEEEYQHIQNVQNENYVNVLDAAGITAVQVKQECEEDDPLNIADDLKQRVQNYNCDRCEKSYSRKACLNRHIQVVHVCYSCNKCDKSFSCKTYLNTHIQSVHGNDHVKKLSDKALLIFQKSTENVSIDTESVHEKVREYNCDKCGKSFLQKGNLKLHIQRVHENIRYNCDKCGKSFTRKDHLNIHIQSVHENVRYKCEKCEKTFPEKTNLKKHIQSTHDKVQYKCDKCEKSFSWKTALSRHMRTVHNKCEKSFSKNNI